MNAEIRKALIALGNLMYYANSRPEWEWAAQTSDPAGDGVYGHANKTIRAIVAATYGKHIADLAMDRLEFGCCGTPGDDVLSAIEMSIEEHRGLVWDALRDYADMWE